MDGAVEDGKGRKDPSGRGCLQKQEETILPKNT
jgi:hypothetical protein